MSSRAGRKRHPGPRQPNGQLSRAKAAPAVVSKPGVTTAMARRLSEVGMASVDASFARQVCRDPASGTALGRLMWVYLPTGERTRRLMADGATPMISDRQAQAAEVFVVAWVAWRAANGLPSRHPGGHGARSNGPMPPDKATAAATRWAAIRAAVMACPQPRLVWAALESVLIDNEARLLLDRPTALDALKRGLEAVAGVG